MLVPARGQPSPFCSSGQAGNADDGPQKRAQYSKELADLPAERAAAQNKQRLSSQITGLAKQLEYKGVDLKATEEKLGKLATELQTLGQARRLSSSHSSHCRKLAFAQTPVREQRHTSSLTSTRCCRTGES